MPSERFWLLQDQWKIVARRVDIAFALRDHHSDHRTMDYPNAKQSLELEDALLARKQAENETELAKFRLE